jgi:ABC-type uncharacterized transport system auxiliary subunit
MSFFTPAGIEAPAGTTDQMREIDRIAMEETGPNLFQMMENAGRNLAEMTLVCLGGNWRQGRIVVLAGTGGNGGGGIVAARHLANHGASVALCLAAPDRLRASTNPESHNEFRRPGSLFARSKAPQDSNRRENAVIRRGAAILLCAAACALAVGCGAARPSKYYQLALPNDLSSMKANDPLPVTVLIGRLKASHLYREDRIVYSTKGRTDGHLRISAWTEPPTEMVEEMLLRELRATDRYQGIYSQGSGTQGDFLLQGRLFDFKEISDGALLARVTSYHTPVEFGVPPVMKDSTPGKNHLWEERIGVCHRHAT